MSKLHNLWKPASRVQGSPSKASKESENTPPPTPRLNLWNTPHRAVNKAQPAELDAQQRAEQASEEQRLREEENARHIEPIPTEFRKDRRRGKRNSGIPPEKVRRGTINFAVSAEEEAICKAFADSLGLSFSAWVRQTLFAAMGRKIPPRTGGSDD
jgi:hypothetical protein